MFINGALGIHLGFELCLVDFFEDVLETTVVLFENGVFGGEVKGPTLEQGLVKTSPGKAPDGLIGIVHGQSHAVTLVLIDLPFLHRAVAALKAHGQFALTFDDHIGGPVLIPKGMTANADGRGPIGNQAGDVFDNDGFPKNGPVQEVTNRPVGGFPHFFESKFLNTGLVRCNGGAFDAHAVFEDGLGGIHGDLVVGGVPGFHAQIVVFDRQFEVR